MNSEYSEIAEAAQELLKPEQQPQPIRSSFEAAVAAPRPDPIFEQRRRAEAQGRPVADVQNEDAALLAIQNSGAAKRLAAAESEFRKAREKFESEKATASGIAAQWRLMRERVDSLSAQIARGEGLRAYWQNLAESIEAGIPEQIGMQGANAILFANSAKELLAVRELLVIYAPWKKRMDDAMATAQAELVAFQKTHKIGIS